jgi:hypothetical protein
LEQQAKSEAEAEAEVFFYYIRERLVCVWESNNLDQTGF